MTERERDFQRAVVELARLMGWRVHHTRPALTQRGRWITPIRCPCAGCVGASCVAHPLSV